MIHEFRYIGCFLQYDQLNRALSLINRVSLSNVIKNPHITFAYRPEFVDESLFGKAIKVCIIGYTCDGKNEGVKVTLDSDNQVINKMAAQISVPHITLSISDDSESVLTKYLSFEMLDEPIEITGVFGGMDFNNNVIY